MGAVPAEAVRDLRRPGQLLVHVPEHRRRTLDDACSRCGPALEPLGAEHRLDLRHLLLEVALAAVHEVGIAPAAPSGRAACATR